MADDKVKAAPKPNVSEAQMTAKRKAIADKIVEAQKAKEAAEQAIKDATAAEIELQQNQASLVDCMAQQRKSLEAARKQK